MSLSAEAQHVIDSLEAHFNALKAAVKSAEQDAIDHVDAAWQDAQGWIAEFRAKLEGEFGGGTAAGTAVGVATPGLSTLGGAGTISGSPPEAASVKGTDVQQDSSSESGKAGAGPATDASAKAPSAASPAVSASSPGEGASDATPGAEPQNRAFSADEKTTGDDKRTSA